MTTIGDAFLLGLLAGIYLGVFFYALGFRSAQNSRRRIAEIAEWQKQFSPGSFWYRWGELAKKLWGWGIRP